jgi:hypothetical protein
MWIVLFVKYSQCFLKLRIIRHFILKLFNCLFLLVYVRYIPLTLDRLWANLLIFVKLLIVKQIKSNCVNALLRHIFEPGFVFDLLSDEVGFGGLLHFVPEVIDVLYVHYKDVTVLVCYNPRVGVSTPAFIDGRIADDVSGSEDCLEDWDCDVILVREHIQVTVDDDCALIGLQEEQTVFGYYSQVSFFHHLIESFPVESIEESNSLQIDYNLRDFVNEPTFFLLIIVS